MSETTAMKAANAVAPPAKDREVTEIWKGVVTARTLSAPGIPGHLLEMHRFAASTSVGHEAEKRAALAEIATRCAPWIRIFLGPEVWLLAECRADITAFAVRTLDRYGRLWCKHRGVAYVSDETIFCAASGGLADCRSTLHHEIFHAIEDRLADDDFDLIDRAAARGMPMPGEYLGAGIERRARLYQSLANAWDEGVKPTTVAGVPVSHVERVCWHIYSGGLARQIARGGMVRPVFSTARTARRACAFVRAYGFTLAPLATVAGMSLWARLH